MKNNNKLLVGSVQKIARVCITLIISINLFFNNENIVIAYADNTSTIIQTINEESVFNTNSENKNVIEGNNVDKLEYYNKLIEVDESQILRDAINEEITNRIDVCKANTTVSETTSNISDVVSELAQSKQQRDLELEMKNREAAEKAVCDAAGENVPNYMEGCRSQFKSYMAYTAVTSQTSPQYKLLNSESAYTDPNTGLRMVDGRYCIAVGTGYCSQIGTKIDLVLENGNILKCILGDVKADIHTDDTNRYHYQDGSVAEFIVDNDVYSSKCDGSGTVNWINGFDGKILKVVVNDTQH